MTDDRQPAYDAVIPARVRYDPELPDKAKLLYGEIRALASREGFCWASTAYFCRLYGVSDECVNGHLRALEKRGHIVRECLRDADTSQVLERRLWVDLRKYAARDRDAPPPEKLGTPPQEILGTPPQEILEENNTSKNSTRLEDPPVVPPRGDGGRKADISDPAGCPGDTRTKNNRERRKREPLPDWEPDRFEKFWRLYPKTESNANQKKADARRAWNQLRPDDDLIGYMGKVLVLQMKTRQWNDGVGVPYASTWIRAFGKEELPDVETLMALGSGTSPAGWAPDPEVMTS